MRSKKRLHRSSRLLNYERTDLNQVYDLETRISGSHYVLKDEVDGFAESFYKGELTTQDRLRLEGLVQAVMRFEMDEGEPQREEFRQILKSYLGAFVAQVVALNDPWLENCMFTLRGYLVFCHHVMYQQT